MRHSIKGNYRILWSGSEFLNLQRIIPPVQGIWGRLRSVGSGHARQLSLYRSTVFKICPKSRRSRNLWVTRISQKKINQEVNYDKADQDPGRHVNRLSKTVKFRAVKIGNI